MAQTPERLEAVRRFQVSPSLSLTYFDRKEPTGEGRVEVLFEQKLLEGMKQEFRTDMDQLSSAIRGAKAFRNGPERFDLAQKLGDLTARHSWYKTKEHGRSVLVQLKPDDLSRNPSYVTSVERLQTALELGETVEKELGYEPTYNHVIYINSLKQSAGELVEAEVFASYSKIESALGLVKDNKGVALCPEKGRRKLSEGETITLTLHDTIEVTGGKKRTVEEELKNSAWMKERQTENYVIVQWNDKKNTPVKGDFVRWESVGADYKGDRQDCLSIPRNAADRGQPGIPIFALLRKLDGLIENWSPSRRELTEMLPQFEASHQEEQKQRLSTAKHEARLEQDAHNAATDLSKHSFGPRQKF